MSWYLWFFVVWALVMGALSLKSLFPISNIVKEKSALNDVLGYFSAILIIFSTHKYLVDFRPSVLLILTIITSLSFVIAVIISIKENDPETEENREERGKAILDAVKGNREAGGSALEAGLSGALAANEHHSDLKMVLATAIVLLAPNLFAIYLGIMQSVKT